jgi:multiple sugar transport system substrate-binding protein
MFRSLVYSRARAGLTLLVAAFIIGYLAACGGSGAPASSGPVTITFWSWVPNLQQAIDLFEKSHPNIHVKLQNVGSGGTEYTKLTTALKAGSGAPDVVQIEYAYLPQYELTGKLVDLTQYGASNLKNQFVPWTWAQVVKDGKIYAIPQDTGPMGLLYREDVFKKYNLAVPTTWDQYAQEAIQLHKANPKIAMTDFASSDGPWFTSLLWQAGSQPFVVNGTTVGIHLDDAAAIQVASYWGNLVEAGAVSTAPDWNNDWYAGLQNGTIATWITAAWAPSDLEGFAPKSAGLWRVAPLPQWVAGGHASANWGGSTDAVTTQSQHPAEAAELAEWLNTNPDAVKILTQKLFLFPAQNSALNDPSFDTANTFYGGQQVNRIFVESSQQVNTTFQWSPFQDYVFSQLQNQLGEAVNGKITFEQAMHNAQNAVVSYARSQGFTVTS